MTEPPRPDEHQQRVVDLVASAGHGPLLVLAGPGTGKTTTLVEAVAARVAAGTSPERVLTLTFSRRAAGELRARLAHRLRRTVGAPLAWTFHGFGFSLVGELLAPDDLGRSLRLLSGPEQEVVVRELLAHDTEVGRVAWPPHLAAALRTRGFTEQVRTFMAKARSVGLAPDDLASSAGDRADWRAAADFMIEYLDVMDSRGLLDYSELIARALAYAESDAGRVRLRARYDLVAVDEYQDTDPAQERLLQAIAGDGRDLVVVGDPDQSIYAFRGADVRGITEFAARFRRSSGAPATILTLRTSRRCAEAVLQASRGVAGVLGPAGSLPADTLRQHRDLRGQPGHPRGEVEVLLAPTVEREAALVAEALRREHLHDGTPWRHMAVLVRSGIGEIPTLQRALVAGGVPVEVAADELPLRDHPVLSPLLTVLEAAVDPASLTPDIAHELLLSPLGGATPSELRRLGRALRDRRRAVDPDPPPSRTLVRDALVDPDQLQGLPSRVARHAASLASVLSTTRAAAQQGRSAHELLWQMWDAAAWSRRLVWQADTRGPDAEAARRALEAVVALFDLAARSHERNPAGDAALFAAEVLAQEVPAGPAFDAGVPGRGVRLLTAHRSKGLEWEVAVVTGVQADRWPDLRHRGSVLQADLLGPAGPQLPTTPGEVRREERRLFYVAATRARRRLLCTAVEAPSDDGPRPSPFLDDLGVPVTRDSALTGRPLTLAGLTAELRSVVLDDGEKPEVRGAAAVRLARLSEARATSDGRPLVPAAHPDRWWGTADVTEAGSAPPAGRALRLSGSQVETLLRCPLQWYLARRVGAETTRGTAAGFGGVVHALADAVARGQVAADIDALTAALDSVWSQLQYPAAWEADQERQAALDALTRFLRWHADDRGRELVDSERDFRTTFTVAGQTLELRGRVDRLERDADGSLVVVDLKTMARPPSRHEVERNLQLATYRALVEHDTDLVDPVGAAELVQLRVDASGAAAGPKVQRQEASAEAAAAFQDALDRAVRTIAAGAFPATPGPACQYCPFTTTCPAQPTGQAVVS